MVCRAIVFRPPNEVIAQIVAFCRETIEDGAVPGSARLLVRQSAGNSLLARRRRAHADAARLGLSDDADLRAVRTVVLRITNATTRRNVAGKVLICPPSANRSRMLERIRKQTRRDDQRLGGRSKCNLSLPGRCGVSALRSRRLHRLAALCRAGATGRACSRSMVSQPSLRVICATAASRLGR